MMAHFAARLGIVNVLLFQQRFVNKVEFAVGAQARPGEVAAAHDADQRVEVIEQHVLVVLAAVEQVAFGVQKRPPSFFRRIVAQVQPHVHIRAAQEAHQFFNQLLRCRAQRLGVQLVAQKGRRIGTQSNVLAVHGLVAQQQAQPPHARECFAQLLPATNAEVGGGNINLLAPFAR